MKTKRLILPSLCLLVGVAISNYVLAEIKPSIAITQDQAKTVAILEELKLVLKPGNGRIGGDQEYQVTDDTLKFLKGKTVTAKSDGSITVK